MRRQPHHDRTTLIADAAIKEGIAHSITVQPDRIVGASRSGQKIEIRVPKTAGAQSIALAVAEMARRIRA